MAAGSNARRRRDVAQFVERFADVLVEAGIPRMPARVFVALLVTDSGRLTAAELGERLTVSPAGVSGAVRYLIQLDLVTRERDPGSRRDHYRLRDDVWYEASVRREATLERWRERLQEGLVALGPATPAGRRIAESLAFTVFVEQELPALLGRWQQDKARLVTAALTRRQAAAPATRPP
jgi:DNA-binding transcriptional regulator GbsR (MarR family)